MTKFFLTLLIVASLGTVVAQAKTMKIPSAEAAVATVEIPDGWNPEDMEDGGATGNSEEAAIYVTASPKKKDAQADLADSFSLLKVLGSIEVDQASKKTSKIKVNGLDAEEMHFQGKETLGRHVNQVSIIVVRLPIKDKVVVLTANFGAENAKKAADEVEKIIQSLKPVEINASAGEAKRPANAEGDELFALQKPEILIGHWKSTTTDGAVMTMSFSENGEFERVVTGGKKERERVVKGAYKAQTRQGGLLVTLTDGADKAYFGFALLSKDRCFGQPLKSPDDQIDSNGRGRIWIREP